MAEEKVAVFLSEHQHAARELAREQKELADAGIKLDETEPGGRFLGANGQLQDSEGNPIGKKKVEAEAPTGKKK